MSDWVEETQRRSAERHEEVLAIVRERCASFVPEGSSGVAFVEIPEGVLTDNDRAKEFCDVVTEAIQKRSPDVEVALLRYGVRVTGLP